MRCPHCGFENSYSRKSCVNCKKDMGFVEDAREDSSDRVEGAGRLASELLRASKRIPIRPDFRWTIFLSALAMMLLLSSLSVTWYRVVTGTTYDLGIFVGHSRGVFDISSYSALSDLMSYTAVGVVISALLMLALVTSSLFRLSWTSILICAASVVVVSIVELRFIFGIMDAFPWEVDWSETTHGPQAGWYMVMLALGLQVGAFVLLVMDEYGEHKRKSRMFE